MTWVLLSLRKSELTQLHSQYVMQELTISRQERQDARHYQTEQVSLQTAQRKDENDLNSKYKTERDSKRQRIKELRNQLSDLYKNGDSEGRDIDGNSYNKETINLALAQLQDELNEIKETHEEELNEIKTIYEDDSAMLEEEANEVETQHEQDKVRVETQMEAVAQELQAISQSISQQIQNETIKIS